MEPYLFLLSYARDHHGAVTPYQLQFFDELVTEISSKTKYAREEIGFLDRETPLGGVWTERLARALRTCQVFVYLQAPVYYTRPWCGKEWQIFRSRVEAYHETLPPGTPRPELMIPVLWTAPDDDLPAASSEIMFDHRDLGEIYAKEGVFNLMRFNKYHDEYLGFKIKLAQRIIEVAKAHRLPPSTDVVPFDQVANAFLTKPAAGHFSVVRSEQKATGPWCALFAYVVAEREEIQNIRKLVAAYGAEHSLAWKPYVPDCDEYAYEMAMQAAGAAKLHYEALPVGNDLIAKLKEAQQANKIVVIILDAWTLKIDRYQNLMDTYNQSRFRNCVVVVPWNQDEETREHADELEAALHATFFGHPDEAFRPRIISSELFHQELIAALNRCRGSILKYAEIRRRAQGTGRRSIPLISAVRA